MLMIQRPSINAGTPAPPAVEVRLGGSLFKRISALQAEQLVNLKWAEWIGTGRRRHLELSPTAPVSSLFGARAKYGTRVMRADGRGKRAAGQALGERRSHLEHIPPEA